VYLKVVHINKIKITITITVKDRTENLCNRKAGLYGTEILV
jgi:hypothetical protein